jgi:hypothetical protein
MPKFTEGDWQYEKLGRAWVIHDGDGLSLLTIHNEYEGDDDETGDAIVTPFGAIYSESDARLMAQSKKMYEYIRDSSGMGKAYTLGEMMERVKAILSSIEEE